MATAVYLPKIGMTMEEGTLTRWLLPEGAAVQRGQPLFELETEKALLEIEADGAGVLRRLVAEDSTLPPGAVVGCLLAPGEERVPAEIMAAVAAPSAVAAAGSDVPAAAQAVEAAPASGSPGGRPAASPYARRLARELGVEITSVTGSGPGGRITESDVRSAAAAPARAAAPPAASAPGTAEPYRGRRRVIGERMLQSVQSMAQLTLVTETRVDGALEMLHGLNREWRAERVAVTLPILVLKACALALREHPRLNARLEGDQIVLVDGVHLGLATDDEAGLVVPVVRNADRLDLKALARAVADLVERAREHRISPDELTGGTFTVTALDGTVVDAFTPIINPPQAAVLGLGRVREVPVIAGGQVQPARVTTLSLTFDHRLLDGAPAALFLGRISELLARPYLLMR